MKTTKIVLHVAMVTLLGTAPAVLAAGQPQGCLAYLDPGSGSYVFMILLGTLFGGIYWFKGVWIKAGRFLVRRFTRGKEKDCEMADEG